jgi:hypothetical protein
MGARAAIILLSLAALAWVGRARAEDDPACAKYQEPMAYNACLARHGPKANNIGTHQGAAPPYRAAQGLGQAGGAVRPATTGRRWQPARPNHGRAHMEFLVK